MTWIEIALLLAVLLGLGSAAFLVGQRPSFWFGLGVVLFRAGWPHLLAYVTKRMPAEEEDAWRKCQLRGGKWNHRTRRCE